jgi:hypothetical protein
LVAIREKVHVMYGGTLITAAGTDPRVAGSSISIAALAPDANETSQSQQAQFPVTDVFSCFEVADGRVWLKPEGVASFAGDLSEQEQKLVWATHPAPAADPTCSTRSLKAPRGSRNRAGTFWPPRTARSVAIGQSLTRERQHRGVSKLEQEEAASKYQ